MRHRRGHAVLLAVLYFATRARRDDAAEPFRWIVRSPPAPGDGSMVYDTYRRVVVLHGGAEPGNTFEWSGQYWQTVSRSGPPSRSGRAIAFDERRQVSVLFGGQSGLQGYGDTWEWDGRSWVERELGPPRSFAAMAYDSTEGAVVLFGGSDGSAWHHDTWERIGTGWSLKDEGGEGPEDEEGEDGIPALRYPAMAYDPDRQVRVLWGEAPTGWQTWEWDGERWALRGDGPPATYGVMFYYPIAGAVCLFATNEQSPNSPQNSFWYWNGVAWQEFPHAPLIPRSGAGIVWYPPTSEILLFGGRAYSDVLWSWRGTYWEPRVDTRPWSVSGASMAYDRQQRTMVVFGGTHIWARELMWGTWDWDLENNTYELITKEGPPLRVGHKMAYDAVQHRTLLYGGASDSPVTPFGDLWEWDGERWRRIDADGPPRLDHAFAFDSRRGVAVLFGGRALTILGDTWEFDGRRWALKRGGGPAPRYGSAMSYDAERGVMVLYGGASSLDASVPAYADTWEYDGRRWMRRAEWGPGPRRGHSMVFDETRGVTLMVGMDEYLQRRETWQWDGQGWTRIEWGLIPPVVGAAGAFDPATGRFALVGGQLPPSPMMTMANHMPDHDLDHVADAADGCPDSAIEGLLVVNECHTTVPNQTFDDGCTMNDLVADCFASHRVLSRACQCVRDLAWDWKAEGLIDLREAREILDCTAGARPSRSLR